MALLLVVTVLAGGYFLSTRGGSSSGSGSATDFVNVTQRLATSARSLPMAATKVQRFLEVHQVFDSVAVPTIASIDHDRDALIKFANTQTGSARTIVDQAVNAANQAADAAANYREAVAFTYRLSNAQAAAHDLTSAAATLDAQAQAWSKH